MTAGVIFEKIRAEQEGQALRRAGQGQAAHAEHQQQDEEQRHQLARNGFDAFGNAEHDDAAGDAEHHPLPDQRRRRIRRPARRKYRQATFGSVVRISPVALKT
jgi:hypothetical protein